MAECRLTWSIVRVLPFLLASFAAVPLPALCSGESDDPDGSFDALSVMVDLGVDSNLDGKTDLTPGGSDDAVEDREALLLVINNDDSDDNGIVDFYEFGSPKENNLLELMLAVSPSGVTEGVVELSALRAKGAVRVWRDKHKGRGNEIVFRKGVATFPPDAVPRLLWLEGDRLGLVVLKMAYKHDGAELDSDTVRINVWSGGELCVEGGKKVYVGGLGRHGLRCLFRQSVQRRDTDLLRRLARAAPATTLAAELESAPPNSDYARLLRRLTRLRRPSPQSPARGSGKRPPPALR